MNFTALCIPYTDFVAEVSDSFLNDHGFKKGASIKQEPDALSKFIQTLPGTFVAGGPSANTLATIANFGGDCSLIGRLGHDPAGDFTLKDFENRLINFPVSRRGLDETSPLVIALITPDGERTLLFNRGDAMALTMNDILEAQKILADTDILILSIFLRQEELASVVSRSIEIASKSRCAFSLQALKGITVEQCKFYLDYADLIIGNEEEWARFLSVYGVDTFADCVHKNAHMTCIMTQGEKDIVYSESGKVYNKKTQKLDHIVDFTGAGDAFFGGVLWAWAQDKPIETAIDCGTKCAALVIAQKGGRPSIAPMKL